MSQASKAGASLSESPVSVWKIARGDTTEPRRDIPASEDNSRIEFSKGESYPVLEMFPLTGSIRIRNNDGIPVTVTGDAICDFIHHPACRARRAQAY